MEALGLIEVYGFPAAVESLDQALKAAQVHLIKVEFVRGGLVTVMVRGDVGAVKASVEAASAAAGKISKVISAHVIPRPSAGIADILNPDTPGQVQEKPELKREEVEQPLEPIQMTQEQLESMSVEKLRKYAREIGITNLDKTQIRFATKQLLVNSISSFLEQER